MSVSVEENHSKAMESLCRICQKYLSGGRFYEIKEEGMVKTLMEKVFNVEVQIIPNVFPRNICHACYVMLLDCLSSRRTTSKTLSSWNNHENGEQCIACKCISSGKKGGRPKKTKQSGRPKSIGTWTKEIINEIASGLENFADYSNVILNDNFKKINPDYSKCLCVECDNILSNPLKMPCDHGICKCCFEKENLGKTIQNTRCPKCRHPFTEKDIRASSLLVSLLRNLRVVCDNGCEAIVPIHEIKTHLESCKGKPVNVNNILSLSPGDEISNKVHKAIGHGIKMILQNSAEKTIEIKTRGQVRIFQRF